MELLQKGGIHMKKVLISIKNELLSTAVIGTLKNCGEFLPYPISSGVGANGFDKPAAMDADIFLLEISYLPGATIESRLNEIKQFRKNKPACKIVVFCDDTAAPNLAYKVTQLKKDRLIDGFLYTSVTANYLRSTLVSL